ncbi:MAG: hypothetical protein FWC50_14820 [Planctomycetaceae bacterium]|nr:hypothetical protein [Planctomycetaceae bacterium]
MILQLHGQILFYEWQPGAQRSEATGSSDIRSGHCATLRSRLPLIFAFSVVFFSGDVFSAFAQTPDIVIFREFDVNGNVSETRQRLEGEIVDLNGRDGLVMKTKDGTRLVVPLENIAEFEQLKTTLKPSQINAENAMANGDFLEAVRGFQTARREETRLWVKRQQTARIVQAYSALGDVEKAAREFFQLAQSDPLTPYVDCAPLPWFAELGKERPFQELGKLWLDRPENPAAQLLSASLSLSTPNHAKAVAALEKLSQTSNRSIAKLATAQLWRVRLMEADQTEVTAWEKQLAQMPEFLRSGPRFLLGEQWVKLGQPEKAIEHWLKVSTDDPGARPLALLSLQRAAAVLQKLGRTEEADGLLKKTSDKSDR